MSLWREEGTGDQVGGDQSSPFLLHIPVGESWDIVIVSHQVPQLSPTGMCRNMGPQLNRMSHLARKCKNPDYDVKSPNF